MNTIYMPECKLLTGIVYSVTKKLNEQWQIFAAHFLKCL